MAEPEQVSKSAVQNWFNLFRIKPYLGETLKLSSDPFVVEKVRDITAPYLIPPDNAMQTEYGMTFGKGLPGRQPENYRGSTLHFNSHPRRWLRHAWYNFSCPVLVS